MPTKKHRATATQPGTPPSPSTDVHAFAPRDIRRLEQLVAHRLPAYPLAPAALAKLAVGLAPLTWLNDLLPDAHRVLAGDLDAAARLRLNLTSLGEAAHAAARSAEPPPPDASSGDTWPSLPPRRTPADAQAIARLVSAAIWAADDEAEAQLMLDGLATALAASHWVHELLRAVDAGPPGGASVRSMTMGPDGFGGFHPQGFEDGGLDPLGGARLQVPRIPGGIIVIPTPPGGIESLIPGKWWHDITRDPETPGGLRFRVPVYVEHCIIRAIAEMSRLRSEATHWQVAAISNPRACPGSLITLTGTGFGTKKGRVTFAAADNDRTAGTVTSWADTKIAVRIAADAIPGDIQVEALAGMVRMCGGDDFPVMRAGSSLVDFRGGKPEIIVFGLHWSTPPHVDFGTTITIDLATTTGDDIDVDVKIWNGAVQLAHFDGLVGGFHTLTYKTPTNAVNMLLRVEATAASACGSVHRQFFLSVGKKPLPTIERIAFVQAIQYPSLPTDPPQTALTVVEKRRTLLRVYVRSPFTAGLAYGSNPGELAVDGRVHLTTSTGQITLKANAPFAAQSSTSVDAALDFDLPADRLVGTVTADVKVWPTALPPETGDWSVSSSATTTFRPTGSLIFFPVFIADDLVGTPAPSTADWVNGIDTLPDRFPISQGGILQTSPPFSATIFTKSQDRRLKPDRDLTIDQGWSDILSDVCDVADDYFWASGAETWIWLAMAPNNGAATKGIATYPPRRCIAVQQGLAATLAHEFAHTLGVGHAKATNPTASMPDNIDAHLPADGQIESGTVGWRPSDGAIFTHPWSELMSYQTPPSGDHQDRWPSAALWNILINEIG
ncbi:hypothetical protein [Gordonia crocea]|uniref:IPT/TIG domain-containing protein n=1 Tax=Gordonia crocea TaxID=589162 RepID=A0A7M4BQ70_9ACTN|nr:hypothetical protein [Gordonia crocea]GED96031.1 hypothetical protein nbrc107697_00700 [Gordonia crocea]